MAIPESGKSKTVAVLANADPLRYLAEVKVQRCAFVSSCMSPVVPSQNPAPPQYDIELVLAIENPEIPTLLAVRACADGLHSPFAPIVTGHPV